MNNILNINFGHGHVLAVEDSMVQAKKIQRFFDENNIQAIICRNGADALESARAHPPIIIISAIHMPVMNG